MQTISPCLRVAQSAVGTMINLRLLIPWECGRDWKKAREERKEHPVFSVAPRCSSRLQCFVWGEEESRVQSLDVQNHLHPSLFLFPSCLFLLPALLFHLSLSPLPPNSTSLHHLPSAALFNLSVNIQQMPERSAISRKEPQEEVGEVLRKQK